MTLYALRYSAIEFLVCAGAVLATTRTPAASRSAAPAAGVGSKAECVCFARASTAECEDARAPFRSRWQEPSILCHHGINSMPCRIPTVLAPISRHNITAATHWYSQEQFNVYIIV